MKKLLIGFALAGVFAACRTTASVKDSSEAKEEACATCPMGSGDCSAEAKGECDAMKAGECSGEAKVCPVTGKPQS